MSSLGREITDFLTGKGFLCQTGTVLGQEIIEVGRTILPISITADTQEKAAHQAESLSRCIKVISEKTGAYPIIITEDRWHSMKNASRERLCAHLQVFTSIFARNCEVRRIDRPASAAFLSANHSYGNASCRHCYGLFLKRRTGKNEGTLEPGTMVAAATFSNARRWIKDGKEIRSYEWTRYASLPGVRVTGGMGRLLKAFIEEVNPDDIMSYADLEWSEGQVYESLGFVPEGIKEPVMFTVDAQWKRCPVKPGMTGMDGMNGIRYFRNFGSLKYRLKLTEYK